MARSAHHPAGKPGHLECVAGRRPLLPRARPQHIYRRSNPSRPAQRTRGLGRDGNERVTLLAELVRASLRVGATPARTAKVRELSSLLRSLAPEEIDTGVHYLWATRCASIPAA